MTPNKPNKKPKQLNLFKEFEKQNQTNKKKRSISKSVLKRISYRNIIRELYRKNNFKKIKNNKIKGLKKAYKIDRSSDFSVVKLRDAKKTIEDRNKFVRKKQTKYSDKNSLNDKIIVYFLNLINKKGIILYDQIVDLIEKKIYIYNSNALKNSFARSGDTIGKQGVDVRIKEYSKLIRKIEKELVDFHATHLAEIEIFKLFLNSINRKKEFFKD